MSEEKEDQYSYDSMLMDFDPDEYIQKIQNKKEMDSINENNTTGNNEKTGAIYNPYAKSNQISSPPVSSSVSTSFSSTTPLFDSNSKLSIGNIDTTRFVSLPTNNSIPLSNLEKSQNHNNLTTSTSTHLQSSPPSMKKQKLDHKTAIFNQTAASTETVTTSSIDPTTVFNYTQTLTKYFGHTSFRNGQLSIINSIITSKKDACVFWSTGSGKSLCYQIPPLHMKKIAIIVSPLISLMEDQVSKLNGLFLQEGQGSSNGAGNGDEKNIAIYLGSGQFDMEADSKALNGDYSFVYCTPEKLLSQSGSFLDALGVLHQKERIRSHNGIVDSYGSNICLIAIDESHCVSEWGHDFRVEYRALGLRLRSHHILSRIPILALTATAIPRVQNDIISSLQLCNPKISQQSFDRSNLIITIKRKPSSGAYRTALQPFVTDLKNKYSKIGVIGGTSMGNDSTIIYCPTQRLVEDITAWLSGALESVRIQVQPYHGGLSTQQRTDAHINFLTGKTMIIVATIAFGMGIDKPDTRHVIHYGPPKSVEEYYQQIGRAGRDGLEAYCTMFANAVDFDSYKDDFYLGNLGVEAKLMQTQSIDALRRFALSDEVCRRAELLKFFGEVPTFGKRCGTCDTCTMRQLHSDDIERDFANDGARVVLYAISALNGKQGSSTIESILRGKTVESWRYRNNIYDPSAVVSKILTMRGEIKGMKKRVPISYFTKDLLPALIDRGFVVMNLQTSSSKVYGQRSATWTGYDLGAKGWSVLHSGKIILPVPATVREFERKQKVELLETLKALKDSGVEIEQIPKQELEEGEGEVLMALKAWHNYLDSCRRQQRMKRVVELEDLRLRLEAWRSDMAVKFRISPADVMQEHLLVKVAYAAASIRSGKMEREALLAIGVRSGGIDDLESTITSWLEETRKSNNESPWGKSNSDASKMILPDEAFEPPKPWEHFIYKANKKTGLASWESSYNRFMSGEHIQAIAMSPVSGRPIQVATVANHIFDGLESGRPIDLQRLSTVAVFPDKEEWELLEASEKETGIDVTGNPKSSGKDGGSFRITDFLTPIMGDAFAAKEYSDRTEEEKASFNKWCGLLRCYQSFRRVGYEPCFQEQAGNEEQNQSDV